MYALANRSAEPDRDTNGCGKEAVSMSSRFYVTTDKDAMKSSKAGIPIGWKRQIMRVSNFPPITAAVGYVFNISDRLVQSYIFQCLETAVSTTCT